MLRGFELAAKVERNLRHVWVIRGIAVCSPDPSFLERLFEKLALAVPKRLACDFAQFQFADEPGIGCGEEQEVFLDRRRQMQQNHDLRKTRRRNMAQARKLGIASHRTGLQPVRPACAPAP